ncbi:FadR/GntR family transcriptional regulator [Humidisolicoccus flavus]|uniref:FadR/GntR family transcriptional regulator n=1 Tax=Humidisolicoccus flavus TaxID=3111414 RepID=UPI003244F256
MAIAEGSLPAGSTITGEELEERLGVSRSVVREIVRKLEVLGMVTSRRRVGVTILPMPNWNVFDIQVIRWRLASKSRITQLRSLTELRSAIEPEAAKLAAVRAPLAQASDLVGIAGRLYAAGRAGDQELFLKLDIEYHALVMEMSGNEMYTKLDNTVAEVLAGRMHYGLSPKYPHEEALALHSQVAGAIQRGDGDAAKVAMGRIMERSLEEMMAVWGEEHGEASDADAPNVLRPLPTEHHGA